MRRRREVTRELPAQWRVGGGLEPPRPIRTLGPQPPQRRSFRLLRFHHCCSRRYEYSQWSPGKWKQLSRKPFQIRFWIRAYLLRPEIASRCSLIGYGWCSSLTSMSARFWRLCMVSGWSAPKRASRLPGHARVGGGRRRCSATAAQPSSASPRPRRPSGPTLGRGDRGRPERVAALVGQEPRMRPPRIRAPTRRRPRSPRGEATGSRTIRRGRRHGRRSCHVEDDLIAVRGRSRRPPGRDVSFDTKGTQKPPGRKRP
jgi:hypothetical protein